MARTSKVNIELRAKEIARRLLWGQPQSEIQAELGLTYAQMHYITDSPAFKETMRGLQQLAYQELDERFREEMETVQSRARRESLSAVDVLIKLMKDSASENTKRDCANDVIRLSGQDDATRRPVINISQATFQFMQQTAKEDDERNRTAIDVDAKPAA